MKTYYCDHFVLPLPAEHRFPMAKYAMLREALARDAGVDLRVPEAVDDQTIGLVHTPSYVEAVTRGELTADAVRRIGFPWSPELVERSRRSVGGTVAATKAALQDGASANLAGGTHHAFADRGEGFCVFNDVAVATRVVTRSGRVDRVAIIDLDVHQGNGTAAIFQNDPKVRTISVHGAKNYPFQKEASDLDIPLPDGAGDNTFLDAVHLALADAIEHRPDVAYYIAGADAYVDDRLGRLNVSRQALADRDRTVVGTLFRKGIPLVVVMGGGYCETIDETVAIHAHSVRTAVHALHDPRRLASTPS